MTIDDIQIKIFLARAKSATEAYVTLIFPIEIDGTNVAMKVGNFRIMTSHYGNKGLKVLPPAIKSTDGKYRKVFFLMNEETWFKLEQKILEKYEQVLRTGEFSEPEIES